MMVNRRRFITRSGWVLAGLPWLSACTGHNLLRGKSSPSQLSASAQYKNYITHDAVELAERVRRGRTDAETLLRVAIWRLNVVNRQINAVASLALQQAQTDLPHAHKPPFYGVPFVLTDLHIAMQGVATHNGSQLSVQEAAEYSDALVLHYRRMGLVIFAKTTVPELGAGATTESIFFGATRNPWALERSPGGESGGAGVAVAAGIVPFAHASDHHGGLRIPASCCGLFGLKPTRARSAYPVNAVCALRTHHAITRSVRDSAALLDTYHRTRQSIAPPPPSRPYLQEVNQKPGQLRIAVMDTPIIPTFVHDDCLLALKDAVQLCKQLGHSVETAAFPIVPTAQVRTAIHTIYDMELLSAAQEMLIGQPGVSLEDKLEVATWGRIQNARRISGEDLMNARRIFADLTHAFSLLQKNYDVILTPTLPVPPPLIGYWALDQEVSIFRTHLDSAIAFTVPYNITGQPAMSVPLYWNDDNLPIGVQFAARFGDEATLLRLAGQLEKARPWFMRLADK